MDAASQLRQRALIEAQQKDLNTLRAELATLRAERAAIASLFVTGDAKLAERVSALVAFARRAGTSNTQIMAAIGHLKSISTPEVQAIGNSLDALFQSLVPPAVLAIR